MNQLKYRNQIYQAIIDHDVIEIVNLISEDHFFIDTTGHKSIGKKGMRRAEGIF
jgi:hypothetical protein